MHKYRLAREIAADELSQMSARVVKEQQKDKPADWLKLSKQRLANLYAFYDAADKEIETLREQLDNAEHQLRKSMKHSPQVLAQAQEEIDLSWLGKRPLPLSQLRLKGYNREDIRSMSIKHSKMIDNL